MTVEGEPKLKKPFEYYLELAKIAPKIAVDDPRVQKYLKRREETKEYVSPPSHDQHGNNFYCLFYALTEEKPEGFYWGYAQELKRICPSFCDDNAGLIKKIIEALKLQDPYHELLWDGVRDLYKQRRDDLVDRLDQAAEHPGGIEAIGIWAWDRINPLLEKAADKMREYGINPEDYYG